MYCTQCGTKLPDGTQVCPNCNTSFGPKMEVKEEVKAAEPIHQEPLVQAAPQPEVQVQPGMVPQVEAPQAPEMQPQMQVQPQMPNNSFAPMPEQPYAPQPPKEKKPLLKNKLFLGLLGGGVALVLAIIIGVIIWLQPEEIEVDQFVTIEYDGYDGYGNAYVYLDETALYEAIMKATGKSYSDYMDIDSLWDLGGAVSEGISFYTAIETIELTPDVTENLSNGDVITVGITYNNEIAKEVDIEFVGETASVTVEGLTPVVEVDPFEGLTVNFSGIAPSGWIEYEYTGSDDYVDSYYFTVDQYDGLRNGDVVTITYDVSDESTLYYGYVATTKSKTYEVAGLQEYADAYADLNETFIGTLKSEAEDTIYAYIANNYGSNISMTNLEYCGYIMNSIKDASGWVDSYNDLYMIYRGDVSHSKGEFSTTKVYYPVRFKNILIDGENLTYEYKDGIMGYSSIGNTWNYTDGYVNPLVAYGELVESKLESYTSESGDGFEVYSNYELISNLEDIGTEYKAALEADAKDRIESYVANNYNGGSEMKDLKLAGEYLLLAKSQGSDFANNNRYYLVFSATVSNSSKKFATTTVYFPVEYSGLVSLPDGTYMLTSVGGIKGSFTFPGSYYSTKGYMDGTKMFSDLVTAHRENYTYVVSDGLKQFGE